MLKCNKGGKWESGEGCKRKWIRVEGVGDRWSVISGKLGQQRWKRNPLWSALLHSNSSLFFIILLLSPRGVTFFLLFCLYLAHISPPLHVAIWLSDGIDLIGHHDEHEPPENYSGARLGCLQGSDMMNIASLKNFISSKNTTLQQKG